MKLSHRFFISAVILGLALTPAVSLAAYMPADRSLARLESIITLTPAQKKVALQIFQELKDTMDAIPDNERAQKGAPIRQQAMADIRGILTPDQQEIYDRTPQRLGGGSTSADPAMKALRTKINAFTENVARTSPEIAAQVGTVEKVTQMNEASTSTGVSAANTRDPALHPDSGTNSVQVTGSSDSKVFKIYWTMDKAGTMSLTRIENKDG